MCSVRTPSNMALLLKMLKIDKMTSTYMGIIYSGTPCIGETEVCFLPQKEYL